MHRAQPRFASASPPNRLASAISSRPRRRRRVVGLPHGERRGACPRGKTRRYRIGLDGHERLDQLRQRVQAGARRHLRRQAVRQLGVDQRQARQHVRAAQAGLHVVFGRASTALRVDLGAGARGGGDGDDGTAGRISGWPLPITSR